MKCVLAVIACVVLGTAAWASDPSSTAGDFPRALTTYNDPTSGSVMEVIKARALAEPFNVVATLVFALAVLHTFATTKIRHWAHVVEERHCERLKIRRGDIDNDGQPDEVSFWGQTLHFLGE